VIDAADLEPAMGVDDMAWYVGKAIDHTSVQPAKGWTVSKVPAGFVLSNRMMRTTPARGNPVEHLVYTDGLAAVSVFIEKVDKGTRSVIVGGSAMGAVHAFGNVVSDHQIIVVGEVPAATAELIAKSVVAQSQ
jgi:sigma-E factor negative regulatory protein RseB